MCAEFLHSINACASIESIAASPLLTILVLIPETICIRIPIPIPIPIPVAIAIAITMTIVIITLPSLGIIQVRAHARLSAQRS